jgi:hypothetical protein
MNKTINPSCDRNTPPCRTTAKQSLRDERGDVPGWVLITLMTAGLVVLMWTAAGPALKGVFDQAMTKVVAF